MSDLRSGKELRSDSNLRALWPGFLTGVRSETAKRAAGARKTTEAAAGVLVQYVEAADRV
jgi:hypothetical protein